MGRSIFITGTDTGVGKTFFSAGMIRTLREMSVDVVGFKPIECGGRSDSATLREASGNGHSLDEINPVWLDEPLSPLAATGDVSIDLIKAEHQKLVDQHEIVIVEGAGGWMVPITESYFMSDLAMDLCDEVMIVAANRLGVINHTVLTYRAIEREKIACDRVILNHLPDCILYGQGVYPVQSGDESLSSNAKSIQQCLPDVELFSLRDEGSFAQLAQRLFSQNRSVDISEI